MISSVSQSIRSFVYNPFHRREQNKITNIFINTLYAFEKTDLRVDNPSRVIREAQQHLEISQSSKEMKFELRRHIIAENARLGNYVEPASQGVREKIIAFALDHKKLDCYINKALTPREEQLFDVVFANGDFSQLILEDEEWRTELFDWILLNDGPMTPYTANDPEVFIKFPGLYKEFLRKFIGRSSRHKATLFAIDQKQQMLMVKIERVYRHVTDGHKMKLRGPDGDGYKKMTVLETFADVKRRIYTGTGEIEMINEEIGLALYNVIKGGPWNEKLGRYVQIDLEKADWIKKVPTIEVLTEDEIRERFMVEPTGSPIPFLVGTKVGEREFRGTHGYCRVLIPRDDNTYELKAMGQFAYPFPQGVVETFFFMPQFHASAIFLLDENEFNPKRINASFPIEPAPNPVQWHNFTVSLKKNIKRGWGGVLEFHLGIRNCTTRIYNQMAHHFKDSHLPDIKISFWDMKPTGIEGKVMRFVLTLPFFFMRSLFMNIMFLCFGSWRTFYAAKKRKNGDVKIPVSMLRSWWGGFNVFGLERKVCHPGPIIDAENDRRARLKSLR